MGDRVWRCTGSAAFEGCEAIRDFVSYWNRVSELMYVAVGVQSLSLVIQSVEVESLNLGLRATSINRIMVDSLHKK